MMMQATQVPPPNALEYERPKVRMPQPRCLLLIALSSIGIGILLIALNGSAFLLIQQTVQGLNSQWARTQLQRSDVWLEYVIRGILLPAINFPLGILLLTAGTLLRFELPGGLKCLKICFWVQIASWLPFIFMDALFAAIFHSVWSSNPSVLEYYISENVPKQCVAFGYPIIVLFFIRMPAVREYSKSLHKRDVWRVLFRAARRSIHHP